MLNISITWCVNVFLHTINTVSNPNAILHNTNMDYHWCYLKIFMQIFIQYKINFQLVGKNKPVAIAGSCSNQKSVILLNANPVHFFHLCMSSYSVNMDPVIAIDSSWRSVVWFIFCKQDTMLPRFIVDFVMCTVIIWWGTSSMRHLCRTFRGVPEEGYKDNTQMWMMNSLKKVDQIECE